ncbi:MAG: Fe-only nitrogenase accessory AnfO family protein [Breznakibacter sp.]
MKIAVFVDKYGTVLPFFSSGVVEVYSDENGAWKCINQIALDLSGEPGMNNVLKNVRMLVSGFGGCNLLVIENVQGIAGSYLSDFKIGIWKFKGRFLDESLLDHVRQEIEKVLQERRQNQLAAAPVLVGNEADAVYELDWATLLNCDASLNSRDVLIPFFQTTRFRELIIICKQCPKWLEQSMDVFRLASVFDDLGDGLICLTITPIDFETGLEVRKAVKPEQIINTEESCYLSGCGSADTCATGVAKDQKKAEKIPVQ